MLRQRVAATPGKKPEAAIEPGRDLRRSQDHGARGRQLDRQGKAIEAAADLEHGGQPGALEALVGVHR
jgi:hypothetical protein